jgi:HemY protein
MFGILWFLFVASLLTISMVWMIDHDGTVVITWLGYEVQTNILTAVLLSLLVAAVVSGCSYLLARILAIKFPNFLKLFFRKNYTKQLEKIVNRHHEAFEILAQTLLALEINDGREAENLQRKFSKLVKNAAINNFLLAKIFLSNSDFIKSAEALAGFGENKYAKILALKARFKNALKKKDNIAAIAYAKQILSIRHENLDVVKSLFSLYEKHGLHDEAQELKKQYGDL